MMLALAPIVGQLKAGGCNSAAGLVEFAAQREKPALLPAYFVVPTRDQAQPNRMSGIRDQRVSNDISVFVVIDGTRRRTEAIADDLQAECKRVGDALIGWTHPGASGPFDYDGGNLIDATGGTIVWRLRFSTSHHIRKAS